MGLPIYRYPASIAVAGLLFAMTLLYWATGALWPTVVPGYTDSELRVTGMALMLICMPSYFVGVFFITTRRSLALVEQLRGQLPEPGYADDAEATIRGALRRIWIPGAVAGLIFGSFNTPTLSYLGESTAPAIEYSFAFGQILLWLIVGLVLGTRLIAARTFDRLGQTVRFDLFQLDRLWPLARSGLGDVLMIAGALAFVPLQSLDAEFRWYNYSFALAVATPAMLVLLLWPMWSLHRRMRDEKAHQLHQIADQIAGAPRDPSHDDISRLESLLAHRDRLRATATWPLSTALVSRAFLYFIIPPLAWTGAALVEMLLDRVIS